MKEDGQFAKFNKIFLKEVSSNYTKIEQERKILLTELKKENPIYYLFACFFLFFLFINFFSNFYLPFVFALVFASFIPKFNVIKYDKKFKQYLKNNFIDKLLNAFGDIKRIDNTSFFEISEVKKLNIAALFCDDAYQGTYKGISFKIAELASFSVMSDKYSAKNKKGYYSGYGQVVMSFDFNKKIVSEVAVTSRKEILNQNTIIAFFVLLPFTIPCLIGTFKAAMFYSINSLFVFFQVMLLVIVLLIILVVCLISNKKFQPSGDKVILEDEKFNKCFKVKSDNQVEARYLCTTAFMDRLYNLKTVFKAKLLNCFFCNINGKPKLIIKISTKKDLFELGDINKPIYKDTSIYEFYREINSIYQIIDALKLDSKTGL